MLQGLAELLRAGSLAELGDFLELAQMLPEICLMSMFQVKGHGPGVKVRVRERAAFVTSALYDYVGRY